MLKQFVVSIVRNYPNFTINEVYDTDVAMLMMLLDDKKKDTEDQPVQRVDFTQMTSSQVEKM